MKRTSRTALRRLLGGAAIATVAAIGASGCALVQPDYSVPPPATATPLAVVGSDAGGIEAATAGDQLYITAPGSAGCAWVIQDADVRTTENRVDVTLVHSGTEYCGANMVRKTDSVDIEEDVRGYDVYVSLDE